MGTIGPLVTIVAALIALSSFIIAKQPQAKKLFDQLTPFQGFIGVGLLVWGVYDLYYWVIREWPGLRQSMFSMALDHDTVAAVGLIGYIASEILLGFLLGFGLIAKWIPGESAAEQKGLEIQKKLLTFSLPIGIIGIVTAVLWLIKNPT